MNIPICEFMRLRVSTYSSQAGDSISENKAHIPCPHTHTLNSISFWCCFFFSLWIGFRFYSILCVMEYQICIKISIGFSSFVRLFFLVSFFFSISHPSGGFFQILSFLVFYFHSMDKKCRIFRYFIVMCSCAVRICG